VRTEDNKRRKIGLNQSLIHIRPFPPLPPNLFLLAPLKLSIQKRFLRQKKIMGENLPPPITPMVKYTLYTRIRPGVNTSSENLEANSKFWAPEW